MKKTIFTLLVAMASLSAMAHTADGTSIPGDTIGNEVKEFIIDMTGSPVMGAPSLAAAEDDGEGETLDYHYCGDPLTALATGDADDIENSAAILLPEDVVTRYAGAEIVSVVICSGFNLANPRINNITDATVFLNHDIFNEEDFCTQRGRLSKNSQTWSEIKFSKPYTLEAGKPVYVGYKIIRPTTYDCPFAADRIRIDSNCSFWVNYSLNGERRWENWAPLYGSLCMHVKLRGKTLPVNNVEMISATVPMQVAKGDFNANFRIRNLGANDVNSISYTCTVGGSTKVDGEYTFTSPVKFSESANVDLSLACQDPLFGLATLCGISYRFQ